MRWMTWIAVLLLVAGQAAGDEKKSTTLPADRLEAFAALRLYPRKTLVAIVELSQYPLQVLLLHKNPDHFRKLPLDQVKLLRGRTSQATIDAIAELLEAPAVVKAMAESIAVTTVVGALYRRRPEAVLAFIDKLTAERNQQQHGIASPRENEKMEEELQELKQEHPEWADQPVYQETQMVQYVLQYPAQYPNTVAYLLEYAAGQSNELIKAWIETMETLYGLAYQDCASAAAYVENLVLNMTYGLTGLWSATAEAVAAIATYAAQYPQLAAGLAEYVAANPASQVATWYGNAAQTAKTLSEVSQQTAAQQAKRAADYAASRAQQAEAARKQAQQATDYASRAQAAHQRAASQKKPQTLLDQFRRQSELAQREARAAQQKAQRANRQSQAARQRAAEAARRPAQHPFQQTGKPRHQPRQANQYRANPQVQSKRKPPASARQFSGAQPSYGRPNNRARSYQSSPFGKTQKPGGHKQSQIQRGSQAHGKSWSSLNRKPSYKSGAARSGGGRSRGGGGRRR